MAVEGIRFEDREKGMKGLLDWREKGYFGNINEISIKALADWAAKGHIFLSRQHKPLSAKTIEEELGEIWRSEYPHKAREKRIKANGKTKKLNDNN